MTNVFSADGNYEGWRGTFQISWARVFLSVDAHLVLLLLRTSQQHYAPECAPIAPHAHPHITRRSPIAMRAAVAGLHLSCILALFPASMTLEILLTTTPSRPTDDKSIPFSEKTKKAKGWPLEASLQLQQLCPVFATSS